MQGSSAAYQHRQLRSASWKLDATPPSITYQFELSGSFASFSLQPRLYFQVTFKAQQRTIDSRLVLNILGNKLRILFWRAKPRLYET